MVSRRVVAVALALCALGAGCTHGRTDEEKAKVRAEREREARKEPADLDAWWKAGTLPPSVEEGTPVRGGTLNVRIHSEPPSLNYLIDSDWWMARITLHNVNESLLRPDPRGQRAALRLPRSAHDIEWRIRFRRRAARQAHAHRQHVRLPEISGAARRAAGYDNRG